jgi:enterochelin esterase-like enzyme
MMTRISARAGLTVLLLLLSGSTNQVAPAQGKKKQKQNTPFSWVNQPSKADADVPIQHKTFRSQSMGMDVGYCIYLPPSYEKSERAGKRYPVVYYLHGGRPGSELKSVGLSTFIEKAIRSNRIPPMIYVFINGGPMSHYDYPQIENGQGESVFIEELIPHVDSTYRTIASRKGRGIEGFSQGGRGTTRIMFRHPELFCSAAPGGGGFATEKKISENDGYESDRVVFAQGYNAYDTARLYASSEKQKHYPLHILIHVGTKGFNYENNLAYMKFLKQLGIECNKLIVEDVPHSARLIYERQGDALMKFHAQNFSADPQ